MQKLKLPFFIFWVTLIATAGYFYFIHREVFTVEFIRDQVASLGIWVPLVYILAYTVRPLVFFPTSIMTTSSVLLFGPLPAWILTYVGENFSANLAFLVGRYFGQNFIQAHENKLLKKYDKKLVDNGFITVLILRFTPLFPFDFVSYSVGLSQMKHWDYLWGTLVGVLPGLTAYILLAAGVTDNPVYLWLSGGLFAILIGGGWIFKNKSQKS